MKARRITSRFPAFLGGGGPVLQQVVGSIAEPLEALDQSMHQVLESHWAERAGGADLERIGSLYGVMPRPDEAAEAYRRRLMLQVSAFLRYGCSPRGVLEAVAAALAVELQRDAAGTAQISEVDAYRRQVATTDGDLLELEEHPLHTRVQTEGAAVSGSRWTVTNFGYEPRLQEPAHPVITVVAGARPVDGPLVVNLTTGEAVGLAGRLAPGARLVFPPAGPVRVNGQIAEAGFRLAGALFDDEAAFDELGFVRRTEESPRLPVGASEWAFFTGYEPGRGVLPPGSPEAPAAEVTLTWEERQRASFRVTLPAALQGDDPDGTLALARLAVARVRPAGVNARVEFAAP
ncbi:MAG TPA: hypothetical protein VNT75_29705 [Symbiobacteriaceae bacterium]|nr:hypothetical protein [Symbiobacteriaceae bacterium]